MSENSNTLGVEGRWAAVLCNQILIQRISLKVETAVLSVVRLGRRRRRHRKIMGSVVWDLVDATCEMQLHLTTAWERKIRKGIRAKLHQLKTFINPNSWRSKILLKIANIDPDFFGRQSNRTTRINKIQTYASTNDFSRILFQALANNKRLFWNLSVAVRKAPTSMIRFFLPQLLNVHTHAHTTYQYNNRHIHQHTQPKVSHAHSLPQSYNEE